MCQSQQQPASPVITRRSCVSSSFLFEASFHTAACEQGKRWDVQKRRRLLPLTPHHPSCLYLLKTHHDTETKALLHSSEGFNCGGRQIRRVWGCRKDNAFTRANKTKKPIQEWRTGAFIPAPRSGELPPKPEVSPHSTVSLQERFIDRKYLQDFIYSLKLLILGFHVAS